MKMIKGFTLIEILIALAVFAIMASITSSLLYHAFTTRTRVNAQSKALTELQLAISLLQQDTVQTVARAIRSNEMRLFPALVGKSHYLEFTRAGNANPGSIEKRSTLKRIAYVCQTGNLIRRTWTSLDPLNKSVYQEKLLLKQLSDCHFGYLDQNLQVFPEWREQAVTQNQTKESLPKAVQINLTLKKQGELNLLFPIPGALYATH